MSDALYPVFDKEGKSLYFTASTDVALNTGADMTACSAGETQHLFLSKIRHRHWLHESDEEKGKEAEKRTKIRIK